MRISLLTIMFFLSANLYSSEMKTTHQPVVKNHQYIQKSHTDVRKIHHPIEKKRVLQHDNKARSAKRQTIEDVLKNYGKDEILIKEVYDYVKKDEWSKAQKYKNNDGIKNFVEILKASKVKCQTETYDELEIYDFLSTKYPVVKALNLKNKMKAAKCSISDGIEYISSASRLLEQYKKNRSLKNNSIFQSKVKEVWRTKKFANAVDEKSFFDSFQSVLTNEDQKARLEKMLWMGEVESAERIFRRVDQKTKIRAKNRIELQKSKNLTQLFQNFRRLGRDENSKQVLLFDSIKWCDKHGMQSEVYELLKLVPSENRVQNEQWWELLRPHIRDLLLNRERYQLAYNLSSHHNISNKKIEYVDAEFLTGFIAYSFLKNPKLALVHFLNSAKFAQQDFRKSRAFYWLGLTYGKFAEINRTQDNNFNEKLVFINDSDAEFSKKSTQIPQSTTFSSLSKKNFDEASSHFMTFYGQLALQRFDKLKNLKNKLTKISELDILSVKNNPIFNFYYYSLLTKNSNLAKKFAKIITLSSKSEGQVAFLALVANHLRMPDISCYIGSIAMYNLGFTVIEALYPIPNYKHLKIEKALNLAIIRRESNFEISSINDAGTRGMAHGLMQIIPAASLDISKELGVPHNHELLLDPEINVLYGNHFINSLKSKWDGSAVLAISSYNAGFGSTTKWIKKLGDFRTIGVNPDIHQKLIWLEQIPFRETRYYVQSVLSNMTIYQMLLNRKFENIVQ